MNKEIYISGQSLDLGEFGFTLSFSLLDLQDVTRRRAFKSSTITVPATKKNSQLFGFPEQVTTRQSGILRGLIKVGVLTFVGDVQFLNTETVDGKSYINFQVICGSLAERLSGLQLRDLNLGTFTINQANITTARNGLTDFNFAIFDHGNFIDRDNLSVLEFLPVCKADYIIETILNENGYTVHPDSDISQNHYIADFSKYRLNETNFKKGRTFTAVKNFDITESKTTGLWWVTPSGLVETSPTHEIKVLFDTITQDGTRVTNSTYTTDKAGAYNFKSELVFSFLSTANFTTGNGITVKVSIKINGTKVKELTQSWTNTTKSGSVTLTAETGYLHLEAGDTIETWYYLLGQISAQLVPFDLNIQSEIDSLGTSDSRRGTGYVMNKADALPDWSVLDFLKGYFTFNNLLIAVNEFSREVLILPYASFFSATAADWTGKLITSQSVELQKYERPGVITFQMVEDGNDISFVDGDNKSIHQFSDNETTEETIQANFARQYFIKAYRIGLPDEDIPEAMEVPYSDVFQELKYNFKTRLLNYAELATVDGYYFEGVNQTKWIKYDDDGLLPADFKGRYSGIIRNMEYSKTLSGKFRVTDLDLQRIITLQAGADFRTPIRVNGVPYYLIEIRSWNADSLTADCLLLQINDKNIS